MPSPTYAFGPFTLNPAERLLRRAGREVALTPKVFELLVTLVGRPGHLFAKDELMRRLWPATVVEEANLTQSVAVLRKALGDRPGRSRYIQTRARRGYRFVAPVTETGPPVPSPPRNGHHEGDAVGREHERAQLRAALDGTSSGRGVLLCVSGEPGVGKTTLVEAFLREVADRARVARGRCSERLVGAEAYLPMVEALDSLLAGDGEVARAVATAAPSWYAHARDGASGDAPTPAAGTALTSQERLKREVRALFAALSRDRPAILFLDDLHWTDVSTVDLLAYLAARLDGLRLLIVVAYRPGELQLDGHLFEALKLELEARRIGREIALPLLPAAAVHDYLARVFPDHALPASVADVVYAKTEGNPLFMVDLVRHLRDREVIARGRDGRWALTRPIPDVERQLPASVRSMIERKISRLSEGDLRVLTAAAVQGDEFDSAIVAEGLGLDPADVEDRLAELDRVHAFVRLVGDEELPDATPTRRYRFVHVLYHGALTARLTPTRRRRLSARLARALADHHGEQGWALASQLAHLYEDARDFERAAACCLIAARRSAALFACREAAGLARRGLGLLARVAPTPELDRHALSLERILGFCLSVTQGYAAAETGRSLARAEALSGRLREAESSFTAVWGRWIYSAAGAESAAAEALSRQLLQLAERTGDPVELAGAHFALGNTLHLIGELRPGHAHLELGVALHDPAQHQRYRARYGFDPGLYCRSHTARTLWLLGHPDQAGQRIHETLELAEEVRDPRSVAHALMFAAVGHQLRREPALAEARADGCIALCRRHGIADEAARSAVIRGWAVVAQGRLDEGLAEMGRALEVLDAMRSRNIASYYLALLAEALGAAGRHAEALQVTAEGLARIGDTGEHFYAAELFRLRGELLGTGAEAEARACLDRAVEIAARQRARSLELRARLSLARVARRRADREAARRALGETYSGFTEGLDTADLREADDLIATESRGGPAGPPAGRGTR